VFCQKPWSAERFQNGFGMIFVFTTIVVNFILLTDKQAGEGQFSGINALITTQEEV
jgi:hypothetical protein